MKTSIHTLPVLKFSQIYSADGKKNKNNFWFNSQIPRSHSFCFPPRTA